MTAVTKTIGTATAARSVGLTFYGIVAIDELDTHRHGH